MNANFIWCRNCDSIQRLELGNLEGPDVTGRFIGGTDLLCGQCRFVIATTYERHSQGDKSD
jgi:hypothetical protein